MVGKDGALDVFWGMDKGSMQIMSPLQNEEAFLVVEEVIIGGF